MKSVTSLFILLQISAIFITPSLGVLLSLTANSFTNAQPGYYWIIAEAAQARSQPKPQAALVGKLAIGTRFYSTKISGDWIFVDSLFRRPFNGWVPTAMVSNVKVDSSYLLKQLIESKNPADSIKWGERLVSLSPENRTFMRALQVAYTSSGDSAKAVDLGRRIRGTSPTYLARNDGKNILVIGVIDSANEFQSLIWEESPIGSDDKRYGPRQKESKAIKKRALALKASFPPVAWYQTGWTDAPGRMVHSLDVPAIVPPMGRFEGYHEDIDGAILFGISLGSFYDAYTLNGQATAEHYTDEMVIFASRPFYRVPTIGIIRPSERDSLSWYQKQLVGKTFDSLGATTIKYRSLREYGYVEIYISGQLANQVSLGVQRGIFSPTRKLVWPPENTLGCENEEVISGALIPDPPWFRFGPDSSFPAFSVQPYTSNYSLDDFAGHNGASGYKLVKISSTGMKTYRVRSEYSGD